MPEKPDNSKNPTINSNSIIGGGLMWNANVNTTNVPTTPAVNPRANYTGARDLETDTWNVHGEYNWALNLGSNANDVRQYVPRIELKEYTLTSSSQLNAFKLFLSQTQSQLNLTGATGNLTNITTNLASLLAKGVTPSNADAYLGPNNGTAQPGGFSEADPYYGLYQGKETGNMYYLPYLNPQSMTSNLGSWKGIDGSSVAETISKIAGTAILGKTFGPEGKAFIDEIQKLGIPLSTLGESANVTAGLASPGISKETIKAFTPKDEGDTITTIFYLFNTENVNDLYNNWLFLYTLTYQNLPNRISLSRMDPPSIYTVTVPGFKRFPVAVISSLNVENVGTTRLLNINNGKIVSVEEATSNGDVKIIPEAYKVTITIQSLLTNTRNLFYYGYDQTDTQYAKINVISGSSGTSNESYNKQYYDAVQKQRSAEKAVQRAVEEAQNGTFLSPHGDLNQTTPAESQALQKARDDLKQANLNVQNITNAANKP